MWELQGGLEDRGELSIFEIMLSNLYDKMKSEGVQGSVALQDSGVTKEELLAGVEGGDSSSAVLLMLGMISKRLKRWVEDFEDGATGETIKLERVTFTDEYVFKPDPEMISTLGEKIKSDLKGQPTEVLRMWVNLFERHLIPLFIVTELADRGAPESLEWLGDYYAGNFSPEPSFIVDKIKAKEYYDKALSCGLDKVDYDWDIERLEFGLGRDDSFSYPYSQWDKVYNNPLEWVQACADTKWFESFPSPMRKSMLDEEDANCSLDALKYELVSRGVPMFAFRPYRQGVLVDLRNISFYLVEGPEENVVPEGVLGVGPHLKDLNPEYHILMDESIFTACDFADMMFELDERIPNIKWSVAKVYDDYTEERDFGKNKATAYLEKIFDGIVPEGINPLVEMNYNSIQIKPGGPYEITRRVTVGFSGDSELQIDYDVFIQLKKEFFLWCLSCEGFFYEVTSVIDEETDEEHPVLEYSVSNGDVRETKTLDLREYM